MVLMAVSLVAFADEEIARFFEKIELDKVAYSVSYSRLEKVEELLVESDDIQDGTYDVVVSKVDGHIYRIEDTNLYIEMPYCYDYVTRKEAVMVVKDSYYAGKKGKLMWVD